MDVYKKFWKLLALTSYLGVFYLRIFHYWFVYQNPITIVSECGPMILIVGFLVWMIALTEKKKLTSIERIVAKAKKENRFLTAEEEKKCLDGYNAFNKSLAIGVGVGFFLGAGSTNIILAIKGVEKFNVLLFIIFELHAQVIAFLCFVIIVYRIKKGLMTDLLKSVGITSVSNSVTGTISLAFGVCLALAVLNMMLVPLGIIRNPGSGSLGTFVLYGAVAAALTALVCVFSYTIMVKKMQSIESSVKSKLAVETESLAVAAKESAAVSQEQSAAVKEIVATMQDSNSLNSNITSKIQGVASQAEKSRQDVQTGVESLEKSNSKFQEIITTNQNTIESIKALSEKIDNVGDIVSFINDMADQAKIIAFNAELEANSAGEAGKNFHIVATEVRRLSDSIIDGTKEIKQKIEEMQHSSDELIDMSEEGTVRINSGCESILALKNMFSSIEDSSELTAKSSSDIIDYAKQITVASEQIFITLKQIAAGVENFSQASSNISDSSENVRKIAGEL